MENQTNDVKEVAKEKNNPVSPGQLSDKKEKTAKPKKRKIGRIIGLIVILVAIWFISIQIMAAERYDMKVQVVEFEDGIRPVMGINPTGESLDFGDLSHGIGSTRYVSLKNDSSKDRYILVWKRGEIADMVQLSKSAFVLKAGEEIQLEFSTHIPPSAEYRYYTGKVMIFKWPKLF